MQKRLVTNRRAFSFCDETIQVSQSFMLLPWCAMYYACSNSVVEASWVDIAAKAKVLLDLWATESASMLLAKGSRPFSTMPDAEWFADFVAEKESKKSKHLVKCLLAEKRDCVRSFVFQK